jgi:hypothetical protein
MSERGQKIFKWIVWIVIVALFAIKIPHLAANINDVGELISEKSTVYEEWVEQIFGN